jgi:hypothetical protein
VLVCVVVVVASTIPFTLLLLLLLLLPYSLQPIVLPLHLFRTSKLLGEAVVMVADDIVVSIWSIGNEA